MACLLRDFRLETLNCFEGAGIRKFDFVQLWVIWGVGVRDFKLFSLSIVVVLFLGI